jgi:LacI family transcriptional regulator
MRFVTYGHKLSTLECDHVGLDNHLAMQLLVQHLLELGHRKIGHIAGDQTISSAVERLFGVREHLAAAGHGLSDRHLAYGNYDEILAYKAARTLLTQDDRPTALITANNVTAIGALRAARDLHMNCPRDVSIATVDRLPWADLISPELTCAAQPIDDMAKRAATWLIERLENELETYSPRMYEFAPELIVGESTCPA